MARRQQAVDGCCDQGRFIVAIDAECQQQHLYFFCNGLQAFGQEVIGTTEVNDGNWHFVAGTYDGATIAMYVDGILQHSYPSSGLIAFNDYNVSIGYNEEMNGRYFSGIIDQVQDTQCRSVAGENPRAIYCGRRELRFARGI